MYSWIIITSFKMSVFVANVSMSLVIKLKINSQAANEMSHDDRNYKRYFFPFIFFKLIYTLNHD